MPGKMRNMPAIIQPFRRRSDAEAESGPARRGASLRALLDGMQSGTARLIENGRLRRVASALAPDGDAAGFLPAPREGTLMIVVHDMRLGGAQQVARTFGRWLRREGHFDIRFVALRDGPFRPHFEAIAPVLCLADHDGDAPETLGARIRVWAGSDLRAIFVNSVAAGSFLNVWTEDDFPVLGFIHEMPRILARHRDGLALLRRRGARIICGSEAVRDAIAEFGPIPDAAQIYPFVEDAEAGDAWDPAPRAEARRELGAAEGELLVCGCGVLHWRKSPERFIETAQKVLRRHDGPVRFVWIGGGPDLDACRRMIRARRLGDRLRITGYQAMAHRLLRGADLFLLPSQEDAFPLVALHAALAGAPVICFEEAGGTPELVAGGCGLALPFGDTDAMADAVIAYARDPARRAEEGRRGREIVAGNLTASAVGPALLAQIREVAGLAEPLDAAPFCAE